MPSVPRTSSQPDSAPLIPRPRELPPPRLSSSYLRLTQEDRVKLFACLNIVWDKLSYNKGRIDQKVYDMTKSLASDWGVSRFPTTKNLRSIWTNFVKNKTIDGKKGGCKPYKDISFEVEFLASQPNFSTRSCAQQLTEAGLVCSRDLVRNTLKKQLGQFFIISQNIKP